MAKRGTPFLVDTHPTKRVVVESLTRDISTEACILDLIDNSVDAARDTIFSKSESSEQECALPESFLGFKINLNFDGNGLVIEDNCGGISADQLKSMVMKFGERSSHPMGIGLFGVGLNRALFKLGNISKITTDTGSERTELILNVQDYLNDDNCWDLPAVAFPTRGSSGTTIEIREPNAGIARNLSDSEFEKKIIMDIGKKYGRFILKGIEIYVNGKHVENGEVPIRTDGPLKGENKFYKADNGVSIHIAYGQHRDHRFSNEPDYSRDVNAKLTEQFGWSVLCNDRAILLSDRSEKTGWGTKFHTEFYGFVGCIDFVCSDPSKLPWDTTKTDIDQNNQAYQMVLEDMCHFTSNWRSEMGRIKALRRDGKPLLPPPSEAQSATPGTEPEGKKTPPSAPKKASGGVKKKPAPKPVFKEDHNQFRTVLPCDIDERYCQDKHLALVHEAENLNLYDFTYSGLALLRILFESTVVTYLVRHDKFDEFKDFALADRRANGRTVTDKDEKHFVPALNEMLTYLDENPDIWGAGKAGFLKQSHKKFIARVKMLNSVVHNPFQPIHFTEAFQIRDEVLVVLRHLIET